MSVRSRPSKRRPASAPWASRRTCPARARGPGVGPSRPPRAPPIPPGPPAASRAHPPAPRRDHPPARKIPAPVVHPPAGLGLT
ncbi:MAG: hypothetical protein EON47_10305 [Acetobacteraceae bacterium]|nr:MAG: hypothetical protein EON47_10305 [Acetobacteraceae bacterium]